MKLNDTSLLMGLCHHFFSYQHSMIDFDLCRHSFSNQDNQDEPHLRGAWIISRSNHHDSFHRFFDTSPMSPSNRYLVYHELPQKLEPLSSSWQSFWSSVPSGEERRYFVHFMNIVVVDLFTCRYEVIDRTLAWGSQIGAQAQWSSSTGKDQDVLYYNTIGFSDDSCQLQYNAMVRNESISVMDTSKFIVSKEGGGNKSCQESLLLQGVSRTYHFNESRTKLLYPCPIYHVRYDGRHSVSPNLFNMKDTQRGYGVDWIKGGLYGILDSQEGIYLNDLQTNNCRMLYSLQEIAATVGIDINQKRVYGFHTKWSSDGKWIMFVMRTIEEGFASYSKRASVAGVKNKQRYKKRWSTRDNLSAASKSARNELIRNDFEQLNSISSSLSIWDAWKSPPKVRTQHLFVLSADSIDSPPGDEIRSDRIKYILSWASKPFRHPISSTLRNEEHCLHLHESNASSCMIILRDGNHPNWIPNTHKISMNYDTTGKRGFQMVSIDIDRVPNNLPLFHQRFILTSSRSTPSNRMTNCTLTRSSCDQETAVHINILWKQGMGHPTVHRENNWIITDEYGKEVSEKNADKNVVETSVEENSRGVNQKIKMDSSQAILSPLWIVNSHTRFAKILLTLPIASNIMTSASKQSDNTFEHIWNYLTSLSDELNKAIQSSISSKEDRSWRCDMHPAWSKDFQYIVVNFVNITTGCRQVMLLSVKLPGID